MSEAKGGAATPREPRATTAEVPALALSAEMGAGAGQVAARAVATVAATAGSVRQEAARSASRKATGAHLGVARDEDDQQGATRTDRQRVGVGEVFQDVPCASHHRLC